MWIDDIDIEIYGESLKAETSQIMYSVAESGERLGTVLGGALPVREVYKCVSKAGGFSAIAFILYVGATEPIKQLYVSSLRVGKREIYALDEMHGMGQLEQAHFLTGNVMRRNGEYNYADVMDDICAVNGWTVERGHNHSKIILMQTEKNWYVVETSANLNTNPQMEQFSFENNVHLFRFYKEHIFNR